MNDLLEKKDFTNYIIFWLIVVFFGPYIHYPVTIRFDHFLLPLIFLYFVYLALSKKFYKIPDYLVFIILFICTVILSTVLIIKSGEYPFHLTFGLGDLENHSRIFMYGFIFWVAGNFYRIDITKIINYAFWMAVILSAFGILQTIYTRIDIFDSFIKYISLSFYEGQHFRSRSVVDLCLRVRAVSTFYSPGNFGLFLGIICSLFYFCDNFFSLKKIYNTIGLLFIVIAGIFTISKVFMGFYFIIFAGLLLRKNFKKTMYLILIFISSYIIVAQASPYADHVYRVNVFSVISHVKFYNNWFGPRFGKITIKKDDVTGFTNYDFNQIGKGYLDDFKKVFEAHPIIGVGYVLVKSGDSMMNHLIVRSGILGSFIFILFLILLFIRIFKSLEYDIKYSLCISVLAFSIGGVAFPTFIQDRSADLFWILCFIISVYEIKTKDENS